MTAYATATQYAEFWGYWNHELFIDNLEAPELATLDNQLALAAGEIALALRQSGAENCSLDDAAAQYLAKINIINLAVTYYSPCGPRLPDWERKLWAEWLKEQLTNIRTGAIEVCAGETSAAYPALGIGQLGWTPAVSAEIQLNAILRRRRGG